MADPRRQIGASGEDAAAERLASIGCEVLERNARTRFGELDIVALDGRTLVFVEVKALRGSGRTRAEQALESIGARKRLQVRRLARAWLAERPSPGPYTQIRFDAMGVAVGQSRTEVVHIPAAF